MISLVWAHFEAGLLAIVVWREARGEGYQGMLAVAFSIMNRVQRPSWWGRSIAEVVGKKWQYSAMAAPGDPQLVRWPKGPGDENFRFALQVVEDVLNGTAANPAPGADSYYDISIPPPKWADDLKFVKQIGRLRFYNLDQDAEAVT